MLAEISARMDANTKEMNATQGMNANVKDLKEDMLIRMEAKMDSNRESNREELNGIDKCN
jgi:hypothetical protein